MLLYRKSVTLTSIFILRARALAFTSTYSFRDSVGNVLLVLLLLCPPKAGFAIYFRAYFPIQRFCSEWTPAFVHFTRRAYEPFCTRRARYESEFHTCFPNKYFIFLLFIYNFRFFTWFSILRARARKLFFLACFLLLFPVFLFSVFFQVARSCPRYPLAKRLCPVFEVEPFFYFFAA